MAMKLVKKTADYKIFVRGDDRYAVQDASGKPVNGEEKVRILVAEDLIKVTLPDPSKQDQSEAEDAPAAEDTAAADASDSAEPEAEEVAPEEPVEEASAEEAAVEAEAEEAAVEPEPAEESPEPEAESAEADTEADAPEEGEDDEEKQ